MAEKKKFKKAELEAQVKEFLEKNKINKTMLTLDWMDSYVAKFHPEKIEEYAKKCASFLTKKGELDEKMRVDIKAIREYFIAEFLPALTDEAILKRKIEEKKKALEEKMKEKKLSPEEIIKQKLHKLMKEDDE